MTVDEWQSVTIPELGISFRVPQGWEQTANQNTWSPDGVDVPQVGVNTAAYGAGWTPSRMLPTGATITATQTQSFGLGDVTIFTIENSDGTAETHAILRGPVQAFDFYARAGTLQGLQTIQPVLNDIVGSVQLRGI
jgi:hypothetical protein